MVGIRTSAIIRSGRSWLAALSPSSPSDASSTSWPEGPRMQASSSRLAGWSSTTRIVGIAISLEFVHTPWACCHAALQLSEEFVRFHWAGYEDGGPPRYRRRAILLEQKAGGEECERNRTGAGVALGRFQ